MKEKTHTPNNQLKQLTDKMYTGYFAAYKPIFSAILFMMLPLSIVIGVKITMISILIIFLLLFVNIQAVTFAIKYIMDQAESQNVFLRRLIISSIDPITVFCLFAIPYFAIPYLPNDKMCFVCSLFAGFIGICSSIFAKSTDNLDAFIEYHDSSNPNIVRVASEIDGLNSDVVCDMSLCLVAQLSILYFAWIHVGKIGLEVFKISCISSSLIFIFTILLQLFLFKYSNAKKLGISILLSILMPAIFIVYQFKANCVAFFAAMFGILISLLNNKSMIVVFNYKSGKASTALNIVNGIGIGHLASLLFTGGLLYAYNFDSAELRLGLAFMIGIAPIMFILNKISIKVDIMSSMAKMMGANHSTVESIESVDSIADNTKFTQRLYQGLISMITFIIIFNDKKIVINFLSSLYLVGIVFLIIGSVMSLSSFVPYLMISDKSVENNAFISKYSIYIAQSVIFLFIIWAFILFYMKKIGINFDPMCKMISIYEGVRMLFAGTLWNVSKKYARSLGDRGTRANVTISDSVGDFYKDVNATMLFLLPQIIYLFFAIKFN